MWSPSESIPCFLKEPRVHFLKVNLQRSYYTIVPAFTYKRERLGLLRDMKNERKAFPLEKVVPRYKKSNKEKHCFFVMRILGGV